MTAGVVYIISDGSPHLKIGGSSDSAEVRRRDMQTGNPERLRTLHEFRSSAWRRDERDMHRLLRDLKHPKGGDEWYTVTERQAVKAWGRVNGKGPAFYLALVRVVFHLQVLWLVRWFWRACGLLGLLVVLSLALPWIGNTFV